MNGRLWLTFPLVTLAALSAAAAPRLVPARAASSPSSSPAAPPAAEPATSSAPDGSVRAALEADRQRADARTRQLSLRLELEGAPIEGGARTPTDLVVVLDRSGSMSGTKMEDARAAADALIGALAPEDRFALVSFSDTATVDIPLSTPPRDGWRDLVQGLREGGSTDMAEGLQLASEVAVRVPGRTARVILVSDGEPDDRAPLRDLARGFATREIPLTAVGIGDDWDETLMAALADAGTGNLHWVTRGKLLADVLASELSGSRSAVAQAAELTVDGPFTILDAGGFPTDGRHVQLGQVLAGQRRSLWLTVAVDEGRTGPVDLGALDLRWRTPAGVEGRARLDAPVVEIVADERVAWSSLGDGWARSVVDGEWHDLRAEVAEQVRRGDRDGALRAIEDYRLGNEALNAYARNAIVEDNLRQAVALEDEVAAQFEGEDQQLRQNQWAKTTCVDASGARKGR